MKTLDLTTWERTQLVNMVASQTGNVAQIRQWFRIFDILELSDDEKKSVGWQEWQDSANCPHCGNVLPGRSQQRLGWQDVDRTFELSFEDMDFVALMRAVTTFSHWPATRLCLDMLNKIEAASAR